MSSFSGAYYLCEFISKSNGLLFFYSLLQRIPATSTCPLSSMLWDGNSGCPSWQEDATGTLPGKNKKLEKAAADGCTQSEPHTHDYVSTIK